ncbi:Pentatricopeptide repeat [Dillenia turbinata]|uniref:Pentatricopeptide repeat n=1 Tax=Dillenia turbinata TaxID=194707 RepID=A0AAN8YUK5_9MAGN
MTPNPVAYGSTINVLGKSKLFREALQMIVAYEKAGLVGHAKHLLHELKCLNNIPGDTATTILVGAGQIEEATWLFHQAIEAGDVKDTSLCGCMINLYSRNKKYANVTEVFEKMRGARYFPDSNVIALVLNAYGKLRNFEKANAVYREMQDEGCVFPNVHFLFDKLNCYPNINNKELLLVVASEYERANRLNNASLS